MIKIGDKVKVAGDGGLYGTFKEMADRLGSKLYKCDLHPNQMLFDVVAMGSHGSRVIYLLKNEDGEFLFDAVDSSIEVIKKPRTKTKTKTKTKTEFVKCDRGLFQLEYLFTSGNLFFKSDDGSYLEFDNQYEIAQRFIDENIYSKVEIEIDERQEFIDAAREITRSTPSSKAAASFGMLFDSGKFKLVDK